jgi:hypothetical protein
MEESAGSADRFSKVMESSLAGAFRNVKSSVEELVTAFQEAGLATIVQGIAEAIRLLTGSVKALTDTVREMREAVELPKLTPRALTELREMSTSERKRLNDLLQSVREQGFVGPVQAGGIPPQATPFVGPTLAGAPRFAGPEAPAPRRTPSDVELIRLRLVKDLTAATDTLRNTEAAVGELRRAGSKDQEHFNRALAMTVLEFQSIATGSATLKASLLAVDTSVGALGASIGDSLVTAIDRASGALTDFAVSGFRDVESLKAALSDLLIDIGKQIVALIIKTLILQAIQASLSGLGGAVSGPTGVPTVESFQAGGPVQRGVPIRVHPGELFVPPSQGNIVPASRAGGEAPQVAIKIVNVKDPNEISEAMASPEGERIILNILARNRASIERIS